MVKNMMFYIFIYIFIVGCSNDLNQTCPGYYLDMEAPSLNIDENGYYHMTFLNDYGQTFTTLEANTGSIDEYQKVVWITNREILIDGYWTNLVNGNSYTDEEGIAHTALSIWEQFVGDTIKIYCGYDDNCSIHYVDSLEVIVN